MLIIAKVDRDVISFYHDVICSVHDVLGGRHLTRTAIHLNNGNE